MAHPERPLSLAALRAASKASQRESGYEHTLREILQQPETWKETAETTLASGLTLRDGEGPLLLTGSGSSHFIGSSLEPLLARDVGRSVRAVPAGSLLTEPLSYLPSGRPGTLVSFARSGDSPESCGVVDWFLEHRPDWRHVVLTCNKEGALATRYPGRNDVHLLVLPERTNDRSLVMTSSFTNLWLAGRLLGGARPDVDRLARAAEKLFAEHDDVLARAATADLSNAVYLGTGTRHGAALESALKMLELNDGRIPTFAESFLGLRHGPMCAVGAATLLVGFLSRAEPARSYERDLLAELDDKEVKAHRLLVGADGDIDLDLPDDDGSVLDVVVGQLLGLFRSLSQGLRPDAPSAQGVISRVVRRFEIH